MVTKIKFFTFPVRLTPTDSRSTKWPRQHLPPYIYFLPNGEDFGAAFPSFIPFRIYNGDLLIFC